MATSKPQVKPAAKFSTSTGTVNQYFLTANTVSGAVNIRRIRYGSGTQKISVDDPIWSQNWNPQYTIYMPFALTVSGTVNQYFLTANTVSGAVNIRRIRYGSGTQTVTVDDPIWSQNWNPHYTIYTPFVLNGTQYFLSVNNEQGRMNIRPIKVVNGSSSVLDPVWQLP